MNATRSTAPITASTGTRRLVYDLVLTAACCAFFFFFGLAAIGLAGADEPRYAQIAREMLARHDWVTPVLNGEPWLEKPILYYWQAMLSYSLFGVSDWAARLPTACDATLLVFGIYFVVRRLWSTVALDAALIAASCGALLTFGRAASTDMPLAASLGLSLLCWLLWHTESLRALAVDAAALSPGKRKLLLAGFYAFAALGTLAKGPIAPFLAALVLVVFALASRQLAILRRTLWLPGLVLYLAIALPWYVLVQRSTGSFFRVFILEHNLSRYGTNVFKHPQPVWFFLPVLLASLLPWTLPAIAGVVQCLRAVLKKQSSAMVILARIDRDARLFLVLWGLLPVLFFSFSGSKLPGYILPALPPFAILAALFLRGERTNHARPALWTVLLHAAIASTTLAAALLSPHLLLRLPVPPAAMAITAAIAVAIFVLALSLYFRWGATALRFITLLAMIVAVAFLVRAAAPVLDGKFSVRPLAEEIKQIVPRPDAPVALYYAPREIDYGLNFYRNRAVRRLESQLAPPQAFLLISVTDDRQALLSLVQRSGAPRTLHLLSAHPRARLFIYWVSEPAAPR